MSDHTTTVADLFTAFERFAAERDWDQFHLPKDLALGLSIEAAEVLEYFRFKDAAAVEARLHADAALRREFAHELADVFWFVGLLCRRLGIDLSEAVRAKLVVAAEKYPVERVRGRSLKYDEYPEWGGAAPEKT